MSKIRILPEILSNQIAAGEVVERPASVVKELVENSLDAGAVRILIEVEKGGRGLIQVSDNGIGMNHDDGLLCIERYATSKIYRHEDLFGISTLGFRGEALPSIASVSKLTLSTRDKDSETGIEIQVEGGHIRKVSEVGVPVGTMISVRQLFYNTPARRKFLKTVGTEMGHIIDVVSSIAMGWPGVQFKLSHNGRMVKVWPAVSDPVTRVIDILGNDLHHELCRIEISDPLVSVDGWVSSPRVRRSTSRGIYVYVNGRYVKDRAIQHALFEGYAGRLMKGQFPAGVVFLKVPFDRVDVNVHPTKHMIRFADPEHVFECIAAGVKAAMNARERAGWASPPKRTENTNEVSLRDCEGVAEISSGYERIPAPQSSLHQTTPLMVQNKLEPVLSEKPVENQQPLWTVGRLSTLRIIGQYHQTYIICESSDTLFLVDQHAAHERIVFEQFKTRNTLSQLSSQSLLIPEIIDFGYVGSDILERIIPELRSYGMDIEPFGGAAFAVKAVPSLLSGKQVGNLIRQMVDKAANIGFATGMDRVLDECLIMMACHAAIRANQPLTHEQMSHLLHQLDQCEHPSFCPHGRPTWIKWDLTSLEKSFNRIV